MSPVKPVPIIGQHRSPDNMTMGPVLANERVEGREGERLDDRKNSMVRGQNTYIRQTTYGHCNY